MGMDQYLLIPFLGDEHPFTSYFDVHQGYKVLTHCHIYIAYESYVETQKHHMHLAMRANSPGNCWHGRDSTVAEPRPTSPRGTSP